MEVRDWNNCFMFGRLFDFKEQKRLWLPYEERKRAGWKGGKDTGEPMIRLTSSSDSIETLVLLPLEADVCLLPTVTPLLLSPVRLLYSLSERSTCRHLW